MISLISTKPRPNVFFFFFKLDFFFYNYREKHVQFNTGFYMVVTTLRGLKVSFFFHTLIKQVFD